MSNSSCPPTNGGSFLSINMEPRFKSLHPSSFAIPSLILLGVKGKQLCDRREGGPRRTHGLCGNLGSERDDKRKRSFMASNTAVLQCYGNSKSRKIWNKTLRTLASSVVCGYDTCYYEYTSGRNFPPIACMVILLLLQGIQIVTKWGFDRRLMKIN